ncbi:RHS repeat domain-containing protein [Marinomonas sp. RS-M-Aa-14]|uniref:RHS repeat domain-containing protein n=1 Tax=Marinomonas sp. RS-M-Aa-14 TaxID=3241169 RepID=UPI00390C4949
MAGNNYGTVSLNYNALGNITQKSDVGTYTYNQTQCGRQTGPHAVSSITGKGAYCYDQNGNLLSGDNRSLTYNSFDKPTYIQQNGETSTFSYGPDRQRYKQVTTGTVPKTVYYIGGYEKEIRGNRIYHRIQIGDVAIVDKVDNHNETIHYTLRDHLGSLIATVSDSGTVKRLFYDPWGKRLDLPVPEAQSLTPFNLASFVTPRGFTGHEHLDNVGLIHMNGRVYDPETARFVSADPVLSDPTYLQSYNRYSYVWNNPLRMTDPSGFEPHGTGTDGYDSHPNYDHDNNRWDHDKDHSKENKKWDKEHKVEVTKGDKNQTVIKDSSGNTLYDASNRHTSYKENDEVRNLASHVKILPLTDLQAVYGTVPTRAVVSGLYRLVASLFRSGVANRGASSAASGANLNRQLTAQEIANGHAFEKHVLKQGEFPGIRIRQQFQNHVEDVLSNPSGMRYYKDGRTVYLQESSSTVVIRNSGSGESTAFQPANWSEYINSLPSRSTPYP